MPVFRIIYRPVFDLNQLDPNTHIVREALILEAGATVVINETATLWIADGGDDAYMKVLEDSTVEYN
jgi:hypothetical protein